jgi:rRNA biogenesis protein RRP5
VLGLLTKLNLLQRVEKISSGNCLLNRLLLRVCFAYTFSFFISRLDLNILMMVFFLNNLSGEFDESAAQKGELNDSINQIVCGYVVKVDEEWVWLTVSRTVMAHLFILDSSSEPSELKEFQQRYNVGQSMKGCVIGVNKKKRLLRLKALDNQGMLEKIDKTQCSPTTEHTKQGDVIGGRIQKILPGVGGLVIQVGPHLHGRVHYTEIVDSWVPEPLSGFHEGQFVKCKVLSVSRSSEGSLRVDLSLRQSNLSTDSNRLKLVDDS